MTQQPVDAPSPSATDQRLESLGVAIGSGLVAAAVVLSGFYSRGRGDLDWSNFAMGILASLGLLAVAGAAYFLIDDLDRRADLMSWPGAFGAVGIGVMLGVALDDNAITGYVAGIAMTALSVGGYYLSRRGPFVLSAIAGFLLVYVNLFDDVIGVDDIDGDNFAMIASAAILVFAVVASVAGWLLPTRDLSTVAVGTFALLANLIVLLSVVVVAIIGQIFSDFGEESGGRLKLDDYDNDVWVILLISAVMCAGWAYCYWITGHVGYRVLIVASLVAVVPVATLALTVEHPTYWELVAGAAGAAVLGFVGLRAIGGVGNLPRPKSSSGA